MINSIFYLYLKVSSKDNVYATKSIRYESKIPIHSCKLKVILEGALWIKGLYFRTIILNR